MDGATASAEARRAKVEAMPIMLGATAMVSRGAQPIVRAAHSCGGSSETPFPNGEPCATLNLPAIAWGATT
jgi:hypothetical protein